MIPIYICEDQEPVLNQLKRYIENICLLHELDFEVAAASPKPDDILKGLRQNPGQGIYFLDVDLQDELNGFELGKEIRKIDSRGFIIYVTTHEELLAETFKYRLEAMDYILKDDWQEVKDRIRECLFQVKERMKKEVRQDKEYFVVNAASRVLHIPLDKIIFFETSSKKHVVSLCTSKEYIEFYGNLAEIQQQTGHGFLRIHRSYLVNREHIRGLDSRKKVVVLSNGETCLMSRSKKNEIMSILAGNYGSQR